jgi:hypothetical protein
VRTGCCSCGDEEVIAAGCGCRAGRAQFCAARGDAGKLRLWPGRDVTTVGGRILLLCTRASARIPLQESAHVPGLSARIGRNSGAFFIGVHHLDQCHGMKPHQLAPACLSLFGPGSQRL